HARGRVETWFLGAWTIAPLLRELLPGARIETHPRYSDLSHAGVASLTSLPPRSAVVAFSAEKVYELAERLRRRRGGAAVVLGALSPRTRNAQVAMYQAGEVHYLVATDAIGMGLNMDVDHVAFAALDKFDGREARALGADELAQIAGRAGRFQRAGSFGTLQEVGPLPPPVAQAIEGHAFPPLQHLVWRSSDLDFSSPAALLAALRRPSPRPELRRIERADDFDALLQLAQSPEICRRASAPETVELLWEVCRIPDFRKLLVDSHVRLLARIFEQLSGPRGQIDEGWMARRIARLDDVDGDIDTLMGRLAFIRTWTYIAHQSAWVDDPRHWQERTMAIEGELSDALHHQLTQRFVARRDRSWSGPREPEGRADEANPFRRLLGLDLPHRPGSVEGEGEGEEGEGAWADRLCAAEHGAIRLEGGALTFEGRALARLGRGPDLLHPELLLTLDEGIRGGARAQLHRRLLAWIRDAVAGLLGPLAEVDPRATPALRGLAYQLVQGLGTIPRRPAEAQVGGLSPADRRLLEGWG
ncbi:MAG: helicase, partial [Myxococcales bacterium]|nr:helicase [Myxococcales bacterium]